MNLEDLRGWMAGQDCVVVGCGPSTADKSSIAEGYPLEDAVTTRMMMRYEHRWTIGCNRSVPICSPDFAVCVEPARDKAIWHVIAEASPFVIFSHIERPHPRAVQINSKDVRTWVGPEAWREGVEPLRLGQSAFYAAAVAMLMGFETIGLIGVDLTDDRYAESDAKRANDAYARLAGVAGGMGSRLVNLSTSSRLTSIPSAGWEDIRTK